MVEEREFKLVCSQPFHEFEHAQGPFVAGLIAGAALTAALLPGMAPAISMSSNVAVLVGGGLLVGIGTRVGNGCTSGHGVCGIPRLSVRSITATAVFFAVAAITVFIARNVV